MKYVLSILAFFMAACGTLQVQAQTVWKLATGYPSESFHTENLRQFSGDVAADTGGRRLIEVHPDSLPHRSRTMTVAARRPIARKYP